MTNALNGVIGEATHFAGDYLFKEQALPNATTLYSEGHTLNNTLGRLQLTGTLDGNLSVADTKNLTVTLQYKDGSGAWQPLATLVSIAGVATIPAGKLFEYIPVPHDTRREHRLQVTTDFNASAVKLTAAVEILPS